MQATFRLMQESGVVGPQRTVEVEDELDAKEKAVAWSEGELGHPWDLCTVSIPEMDDYTAEIRI